MNSALCLIDMSNDINAELMIMMSDKDIEEEKKISEEEKNNLKEKLYAQFIRRNMHATKFREENRASYNEDLKLRMRENLRTKPEYKEKQRALYFRKRYGVETKEEVDKIKAEKQKIKDRIIIEKHDKLIEELNNKKPNSKGGRKKVDFETFVKTKLNLNE